MCEQIGWAFTALTWLLVGLVWSIPFVVGFIWHYDKQTEKLRIKNHV